MICEYCHKGNRSIAKFCKWCGKPISNQNLLEKMVGQAEVKAQLKSIVDTYTYLRSRKDISVVRLSINVVIIGDTGTGKTSTLLLPMAAYDLEKKYFFKEYAKECDILQAQYVGVLNQMITNNDLGTWKQY